jgi:type VI protein secretion system component VasF
MFRKKTKQSNDNSTWGGADDFWGGEMASSSPLMTKNPTVAESLPATAPSRKRPLIEHLEPLLLYICQQHRIVRESRDALISFDKVRAEVARRIDAINEAARLDPVLRQHYEKLRDPIYWYVDSTFGSPVNRFPFRQKWNESRLGDYGDGGNLSGDDAFFDELEKELQSNPADEASNERLVFYYLAIGLGFTGRYFKRSTEHREALRQYMDKIYPRITRYLDTEASGRITPESYSFTDKRDFVAPSRDKPMIFFAAFLLLFATLAVGYLHWYESAKEPIRRAVEHFQIPE